MLIKRSGRCFASIVALLLASACASTPLIPAHTPSALAPHGPAAARIAELWWVMLAVSTVIFVLVVGLLFAALGRGRRATSATAPDNIDGDTGRRWPIWGGIIFPLVVIGGVFGYSIYTLAAIENPREQPAVRIKVIGRRWWWDVRYTDDGFATANEIHIPVGVPVALTLESADVIHSFWVPELHGKMDLVPTRINDITIQADEAGVYRGQCAEFCGLQHAHMALLVIAQSQNDYDTWVAAQKQPAATPSEPNATAGQQTFLSAGCVFCHTVRGLEDKSIDRSAIDLGPDLTHISSRLTIAGASLADNPGNLAGWVVDAQHVKPGSLMPNIRLDSQDLQNLLAYLATLR
jgi:cytochrome c oxidase subunit 2